MNNCQAYLMLLDNRLAASACGWADAATAAYIKHIVSFQCPDGGFRGRGGSGDLYYTAFGVRALKLLGVSSGETISKAAAFAGNCHPTNAIDLLSQLYCLATAGQIDSRCRQRSMALLDTLKRDNGGYAKSATSKITSTYHSFLAALCYDLLSERPPALDECCEFLLSRQCNDGGFAESDSAGVGSVNPTAAAAAVLTGGGHFTSDAITKARQFLLASQSPSGGWLSSATAPIADLLSSFTAMVTLSDLGYLDSANTDAAASFIRSCRKASADCFGAWPDDSDCDVEYSFYGLGASAILSMQP